MSCADHALITPFHNAADHLAQLVASIAAQSLKPCQWVFVDDASNDSSLACLRASLALHSEALGQVAVELISLPQRGGVSRARNHGLARVKASRVSLVDADDSYTAGFIARMAYLADCYDPDLVVLSYILEPSKVVEPDPSTLVALGALLYPLEDTLLRMEDPLEVVTFYDFPLGPGSNVCCKMSFLQQNRYDESTHFFEGVEFWYRCLRTALHSAPRCCLLETGNYLHVNQVPGSLSRRRLSPEEAGQLPGILRKTRAQPDRYDQRLYDLVLARWFPNMLKRIESLGGRIHFLTFHQTYLWRFLRIRTRRLLEKR